MSTKRETPHVIPNSQISADVRSHLEELQAISHKPGLRTNISSRLAHIDSILGEREVYATLRLLRWPELVVCPRCHSSRVILRDRPKVVDPQHAFCDFYKCLDCEAIGREALFDDLTGLELDEVIANIRTWILCWYFSFFCPTKLIAEFTGLNLTLLSQIIGTIHHIEVEHQDQETPQLKLHLKLKKQFEGKIDLNDTRTEENDWEFKREIGTVFKTGDTEENANISDQRNKEHAGAPTFRERLGRPAPQLK